MRALGLARRRIALLFGTWVLDRNRNRFLRMLPIACGLYGLGGGKVTNGAGPIQLSLSLPLPTQGIHLPMLIPSVGVVIIWPARGNGVQLG